jgi:mxaJ protein
MAGREFAREREAVPGRRSRRPGPSLPDHGVRRLLIELAPVAMLLIVGLQPAWAQQWELKVCADANNLPYSNRSGEGFENRIAEIIADDLGAELSYVWFPQRWALAQVFREGDCDLVMGVSDGHSSFLTTLPYYRSSYVFLYRENGSLEPTSLDDPELRGVTIGVHVPPGGGISPPAQALANRGLVDNVRGFPVVDDYSQANPLGRLVAAVAKGQIDVAVAWGPIAGYFAHQHEVELALESVKPQIEPPFLPMVFAISIGLRKGDEDFRDRLHVTLARHWEEIQAVLRDYGVPLEPLPKPALETAAQ